MPKEISSLSRHNESTWRLAKFLYDNQLYLHPESIWKYDKAEWYDIAVALLKRLDNGVFS